jgi:hypothetical protein
MANVPTIILQPDVYKNYKAQFYPLVDEMTDGKLTGLFNAIGMFVAHY